jgi:sterol desaturase/sphingolipid hydroxylase (fatty acid hydroxylase superfamily)
MSGMRDFPLNECRRLPVGSKQHHHGHHQRPKSDANFGLVGLEDVDLGPIL